MTRFLVLTFCAALVMSVAAPSRLVHPGPAPVPVPSAARPDLSAPLLYSAPLPMPLDVLRRFVGPPSAYGAGHRGVDLAAAEGAVVSAAADGRVGFAGRVAGRGVLVIAHSDGVLTEYEPVRPTVAAGATVRRGEAIALVKGAHDGCAPRVCLHWGARRAGAYFDPLSLLRPLGPVRLLPWTRP